MPSSHVIVDGSNIATEGRTEPSLRQLDEAVRAFLDQHPHDKLTVVVDATFQHRIAKSERDTFESAILAGEMVTPPAGAIGRGDAFVLEIAERTGATVLSNDSFQEFHGEHDWLFDDGRLVGGKPVPDVGWVFVARTPVRGTTSRKATGKSTKAGRAKSTSRAKSSRSRGGSATKRAAQPSTTRGRQPKKQAQPPAKDQRKQQPRKRRPKQPQPKQAKKTDEGSPSTSQARRRGVDAINEAMPFIDFIADHPIGSRIQGTVDRFVSHGAYVVAEGLTCYTTVRHLGDPPPRSAKEVLTRGDRYTFVVDSIDTPRRGIDLALPGFESTESKGGSDSPDRDSKSKSGSGSGSRRRRRR